MEDIAKASKVGRRTIYSHFKSKEELYSEVVNSEINSILVKLKAVTRTKADPLQKLENIFIARMHAVEDLTMNNVSLRKDFLYNINRIENLRKNLDHRETELIEIILMEGNSTDCFKIEQPGRLAYIIQCSLKALEIPFIKDSFGDWSRETLKVFTTTIKNAVFIK